MKTAFAILFTILNIGIAFSQPNCTQTSVGYIPMNDLGTGISPETGLMGGLYPNGFNFPPLAHREAGLSFSSQVQCLDTNGNADEENGKIVWMSIGVSNTTQETQQFIPLANAFPGKNPKLILVDGALGSHPPQVISLPSDPEYTEYWDTISARLATAGVTSNQVQVIWFKAANPAESAPIQAYHDSLVVQYKRIMNEIKTRFPNVKLCYMASRSYAGYASTPHNPEPYAYWTGWAVKRVIEDQINGDAQLQYSGPGANAPWLAYGIYLWADGTTPRNDGLVWNCPTDFESDGTHVSLIGEQKVANLLLNFFSSNPTSAPWFMGNGCALTSVIANSIYNSIAVFPNPFSTQTTIQSDYIFKNATLTVYNSFGQTVKELKNLSGQTINLLRDNLASGLYFFQVVQDNKVITTDHLVIID